MTDDLRKRLLDYWDKECVLSGKDNLTGFVFKNHKTNTRFKDVRKPWKRLKERFNLPKKITIHDIRHLIGTYTQNYLDIPTIKVQQILGHTNIQTTTRYITDNPENSKYVVDSLIKSVSP